MDAQFTGNQISQLRKARKLTQRELAERLHVTDKAVSKWERGVNFPDLGLLENLAEALGTTPAVLLGLENANQSETLTSLAEISREQLEEAKNDLRIFSWGSVAAALILILTYQLAVKDAVEFHYLFRAVIFLLAHVGWWYLFKYGEMKKWEPAELGTFSAAALPILIWQGYMFLTGDSLSQWFVWVLVGISCVFAQIHFIQVMRPRFMQLLPLTLSVLFAGWQLFLGRTEVQNLVPLFCCLTAAAIDLLLHPEKRVINWKNLTACIGLVLILVLLICLFCYPALVRTYVTANQDRLADYAYELLETGEYDTYGPWKVTAYPALGIVEFQVTAHGLVPESTYEGFYYSPSGEHVPFPGFDCQDHNLGVDALFLDQAENSDNFQTSAQFAPNWFWYSLHY